VPCRGRPTVWVFCLLALVLNPNRYILCPRKPGPLFLGFCEAFAQSLPKPDNSQGIRLPSCAALFIDRCRLVSNITVQIPDHKCVFPPCQKRKSLFWHLRTKPDACQGSRRSEMVFSRPVTAPKAGNEFLLLIDQTPPPKLDLCASSETSDLIRLFVTQQTSHDGRCMYCTWTARTKRKFRISNSSCIGHAPRTLVITSLYLKETHSIHCRHYAPVAFVSSHCRSAVAYSRTSPCWENCANSSLSIKIIRRFVKSARPGSRRQHDPFLLNLYRKQALSHPDRPPRFYAPERRVNFRSGIPILIAHLIYVMSIRIAPRAPVEGPIPAGPRRCPCLPRR